jgi:IS30 family transposase
MSQADTPVLIRTSAKPPQDQDEKGSLADREEISRCLAAHMQQKDMAAAVGRNPSVVSREITRHGGQRAYRPDPRNGYIPVYFAHAHSPWERGREHQRDSSRVFPERHRDHQ